MLLITSKDNAHIKTLRKLLSDGGERRESGRFVLEGARLVADAVKSGVTVLALYVTQGAADRLGAAFEVLRAGAKECFLLDDALAARVGDTKTPQGIFALCEGTLITPGLPAQINGGCLMLHALQDPGNVGTILRSAESFGLSAVILSGCPDVTSPKVLRAGMGAAFRIPIFEADILFAIDALHASGHRVYAASLGEGAVSVEDVNLKSAAVVIGNEGSGLAGDVVSRCDSAVILPIGEKSESLNAAMAATVFAWEMKKAAGRDCVAR